MIYILPVIKIAFKLPKTSLLSIIILVGALSTGTVFAANTILNPGERIFFDGGTDTSIREGLANRIFFEAGGNDEFIVADGFIRMTEGFAEFQNTGKVVFVLQRKDTLNSQSQLGSFDFRGKDNAGNVHSYGKILAAAGDPTDGTEDGFYTFFVSDDGNPNVIYLRLDGRNKDIDVFKTLDLNGNDINMKFGDLLTGGGDILLGGGDITSNADICIGTCP